MLATPIYLLMVYFYLQLPMDFSILSLFCLGVLPIILTVIKFKPVAQRPFLSIFWIIFFINLYLDNLLNHPKSLDVIYRAVIFCPYLLVAGFLPFKINQLTLNSPPNGSLYIFKSKYSPPGFLSGIIYFFPSN